MSISLAATRESWTTVYKQFVVGVVKYGNIVFKWFIVIVTTYRDIHRAILGISSENAGCNPQLRSSQMQSKWQLWVALPNSRWSLRLLTLPSPKERVEAVNALFGICSDFLSSSAPIASRTFEAVWSVKSDVPNISRWSWLRWWGEIASLTGDDGWDDFDFGDVKPSVPRIHYELFRKLGFESPIW